MKRHHRCQLKFRPVTRKSSEVLLRAPCTALVDSFPGWTFYALGMHHQLIVRQLH